MRTRNVIFTIIAILILTCTFGLARTTTTDLALVKPVWTEGTDILDDINANSDILEAFANDPLEFDTGERLEDRVGAMFTSNTETGVSVDYQDADNTIDVVIGANDIVESMLKAVNAPADEDILTFESAAGDFEWHTPGELALMEDEDINTFTELQNWVTDKTLVNEEDVFTIDANWVNTANPWADNEVSDTLTCSAITVADESADTENFILFTTTATGDLAPKSGTNLTFNSSTGALSTTSITVTGVIATATNISMTGELDITGALGCIDLNPAFQTTKNIIDLTPTATINATQLWRGFYLDGSALDPNGVDVEMTGAFIDFSGVSESNSPMIHGFKSNVPFGQDAFHIQEGQLHIDTVLPSTAVSEFTTLDIVIDSSALVSTSEHHAIDVATTGTPSGYVAALGVHTGIDVIHQHIGTFTTPSQTEFAGVKHTGGNTWVDGIDAYGVIFAAVSDAIYVGSAAEFAEIEVIMTTGGTKSIKPKFYYNTAADSWTEFFPADDTDGFQQSGEIRWELASITTPWTGDGDPGVGETTEGYWIKIVRTRVGTVGSPDPTTVKTGTVVEYKWDSLADLDVNDIAADNIVVNSTDAKGIEITGANTTAQLHIAGTDILANGEQAIWINCPSETNATNAIWISLGSTVVTGDLTGIRSKVTTNAVSGGGAVSGQNVRGVYAQAIGAAGDDAGLLQGGLFVADASAGGVTAYNVHVLAGHYSSGASTTIGGDLYVGYLRSQTRSTNARSVTGKDALLCLENEAIEGVGMQMDAAIYIKSTNVTTPKAFDYGIDMSGVAGEINTADIRLSNGETISNTTDGTIAIGAAVTATSLDLNGATGDQILTIDSGRIEITGSTAWHAPDSSIVIAHQANNGLIMAGIGTTYDFTLASSIGQVIFANPTGSNNLAIAPTIAGSVGIRTASPSAVVDINVVTDGTPNLMLSEDDVTKWEFANDPADDALQVKAGATLRYEFHVDGTANADVAWGVFSPDVQGEGKELLAIALEDANKPVKPYEGIPVVKTDDELFDMIPIEKEVEVDVVDEEGNVIGTKIEIRIVDEKVFRPRKDNEFATEAEKQVEYDKYHKVPAKITIANAKYLEYLTGIIDELEAKVEELEKPKNGRVR